jgi:serine phosphatase RsbU (regulator of sigma subunit)
VDSSSTRKYEGTGIGLSLAKELVEMHGGLIEVDSKSIEDFPENNGTTFTLNFPLGKDHFTGMNNVNIVVNEELEDSISDHRFIGMREMVDVKVDKISGKKNQPVIFNSSDEVIAEGKSRILIVDDNEDMRNFLKFLLHEQYEIYLASDGSEGLNLSLELKPDLIITDVMMPVMNGYEMTRHIKENERTVNIPVIMLTAKAEITNKIEGFEYGADDYLAKPFNSKELLTRVSSLLKTYNYQKLIIKRNKEMEDELEIARLLQMKLLPQDVPLISGYKAAFTYIPMERVGGDFYDYQKRDNLIDFFIADVSGHGLPGAFLALITKMTLDGIKSRNFPSRVLYNINEVICRSTVKENYVTTFFATLDTETNFLRYSNAGHFPPFLYKRKTDEFIELNAKGTPLGWFKDIKLDEKEVQLSQGDRLVIYTDGITECHNKNNELFGDERFKQFIRGKIDLNPDDFSKELLKSLKEYSGENQFDDDLTMIVFDIN